MQRFLPGLLLLLAMAPAATAQDMMFRTDRPDLAVFNDTPIWIAAARCAAFEDTVEEAIELRRRALADSRRKWPGSADSYWDDPAWEQRVRERAVHDRAYWRRFGLARLGRDRPGGSHEAQFDARAAEELADLRRTRRSEGDRRNFSEACFGVLLASGGSVSRVERGIADRILTAGGNGA